jgi:4-hydroxy-3-methylbut-2-en-1-yl diphosphate synthase IspG/GcpE
MWRRGNMGNMMNNPGELNKADIEYAVKRFLNDASDYANTDEYKRIKGVITTFMEYVEEL